MSSAKNVLAPYFINGTWSEGPDILMNSWTDDQDFDVARRAAGFEYPYHELRLGNYDLNVTAWSRKESPRYMFGIQATSSELNFIYADFLPDVLDLLAKWLPMVRDSLIITILGDGLLDEYDAATRGRGLIERLAHRATQGAT
jgi:hypothetical protein